MTTPETLAAFIEEWKTMVDVYLKDQDLQRPVTYIDGYWMGQMVDEAFQRHGPPYYRYQEKAFAEAKLRRGQPLPGLAVRS